MKLVQVTRTIIIFTFLINKFSYVVLNYFVILRFNDSTITVRFT